MVVTPRDRAARCRRVSLRASWRGVLACLVGCWLSGHAGAAELADAWAKLRTGEYEDALAAADAGRKAEPREEGFWRVEIEALLALGRYDNAFELAQSGLRSSMRDSLRIRLIAVGAARLAGEPEAAERLLRELNYIVKTRTTSARETERVVALGEAALLLGAEPRLVLENFLKRGRESKPPIRDAFLASGRLALAKQDYALASRTFQQGLAVFPDDANLWAGLAAAFVNGDRTKLVEYAEKALEFNKHHADARLLLAEHHLDSEEYTEAAAEIDRVLAVNPHAPEAHALRAVLAQLRHDPVAAAAARTEALASWPNNPQVDTTIGRKLAQHGSNVEAAEALGRALAFDPTFAPARIELAQALLRSGREAEGWALADSAHAADGYDVIAYNLVNLRDQLAKFTTLTTPHFELRMGVEEAPIYGDRALALLERAHEDFTARYRVAPTQATAVEIFPNPKDFSVRTFGRPGGPPEYLGVCFGPLVTVNSPTSKRSNWEATLWHEYMHTITGTLTRDRVPKWLTEGVSVYEQTRANPGWAIPMSVDFYLRIVDGRMQPISRMSAAFLEVKTIEDHIFAYYETYLVVQFIVETYGFDKLRATLAALGDGTEINAALAQNVAPIDELDAAFAKFARAQADRVAGPYELRPPDNRLGNALASIDRRNLFGQLAQARELQHAGRGIEARFILKNLTADGFYLPGHENIHQRLAELCRELGDTAGERDALTVITEHESDALEAVARLLEIAESAGDATAAARWADQWLTINPLAPTPWRALFTAREKSGDTAAAIVAGDTLLRLDPPDRAAVHYRLAQLWGKSNDVEQARHHVLLALEEAPRFRRAHALLDTLPLSADVAATQPEKAAP